MGHALEWFGFRTISGLVLERSEHESEIELVKTWLSTSGTIQNFASGQDRVNWFLDSVMALWDVELGVEFRQRWAALFGTHLHFVSQSGMAGRTTRA